MGLNQEIVMRGRSYNRLGKLALPAEFVSSALCIEDYIFVLLINSILQDKQMVRSN